MDGYNHLTYTTNIVYTQYCVYIWNVCHREKAVINSLESYLRSIYVYSKSTNRQFHLYIFKWKSCAIRVHFRNGNIRFHAMERDSFLEYALPSHSWSDGNGSCRNLQRRAPYFSITIIMQTTKRVRQAVAGQKTCKPIIKYSFISIRDYRLFATSVLCNYWK